MDVIVDTKAVAASSATAIESKSAASVAEMPETQDGTAVKKKDIRKHPKYTFMYEVHEYNALYHVSDPCFFNCIGLSDIAKTGRRAPR